MQMSKYLKIALLGAAGLVLFGVTFTMVAVFSGAPLKEVAVIGRLVGGPDERGDDAPAVAMGGSDEEKVEPVSGEEALMRNAGLLSSWNLPAPFTGSELHKLQKELTDQIRENSIEREKLRVRSLELDEMEQALKDKYAELAGMRSKLEELESSLDLRQAELERDEKARAEREVQGWKDVAKLLSGGKPKENALLIAEEDPEYAARILRELGEAQAGEILRLIEPSSERRKFLDAYRKAAQVP